MKAVLLYGDMSMLLALAHRRECTCKLLVPPLEDISSLSDLVFISLWKVDLLAVITLESANLSTVSHDRSFWRIMGVNQ